MSEYTGSFKRFEGEIIHLYKSGMKPIDIEVEFLRRSDGRPYLAGGAYDIPSSAMISYILMRAGVLKRTHQLNLKALDTRIRSVLQSEGLSLVNTETMSDAELLRFPSFGRKSLKRIREMIVFDPQNSDCRFQHLSELSIG